MYLQKYTPDFSNMIEQYQLDEKQLLHTGTPEIPITISQKNHFIHPILAIEENRLTNFFVLDEKKDVALYTTNKQAILLRTFSTDTRYQGQGHAKEVLRLLPNFVRLHFPNINEVILAVNENNIAAQTLYQKNGFKLSEKVTHGEFGRLYVMNMMLNPENNEGTKIIENEQLYLREFTSDDFDDLCQILEDKETMYAYEAPFTKEKVKDWLTWNMTSYKENGFGLWAIIDQTSHAFVGQCGIVYSDVESESLLEIGYLVNKRYWNRGYASSASQLCLTYAKHELHAKRIHSIIRDNNSASQKVAEKNGMTIIHEFDKDYSGQAIRHFVYSIDLNK
ncbi:GNAT family N-acetyltransferase [Enterococcus quebecensis]|nr:GNAT family N-acetyltransferase [Enterococcus quebecensis]OJG75462.1 hypothetical protein RV12_GL001265 [Enterococcus quebecensis]